MTLNEFILNWNRQNKKLTFLADRIPVSGSPANIEIRFSAVRYKDVVTNEKWDFLQEIVEAKSHQTMYVVTDEFLFERGIIKIAVSSASHNYQERLVVGTLWWLGEEFFGAK